ncbi:hypothetical protein V3C99_010525 [Haemonchus contortus]
MAHGSQSETTDRDQDKELPLWASTLLKKNPFCRTSRKGPNIIPS